MRTTFANLQASRIPKQLGVCATDSRLLDWCNTAQQRLLIKGHWWGTTPRVSLCCSDGCVTLPPQVATLEKVALCGRPIPVHDSFFEFIDGGHGVGAHSSCGSGGSCGIPEANYRGRYCTYLDIIPTGKKLKLSCDLASDVVKSALLLGWDDNGNWIRTIQGGSVSDGEVVAFSQGIGTTSVNNFSTISDIQLPSNMDGQSWLFEYNVSTTTVRLLANYQYFETNPSYARYYFPSLAQACPCSNGSPNSVKVEAIVKLDFIPVKLPTDYLIIGNLPALEEMMVALQAAENATDLTQKVAFRMAGETAACAILNSELDHYMGAGRRQGMEVVGSSIGELNPVENFI